jgi:hypothetical protein
MLYIIGLWLVIRPPPGYIEYPKAVCRLYGDQHQASTEPRGDGPRMDKIEK